MKDGLRCHAEVGEDSDGVGWGADDESDGVGCVVRDTERSDVERANLEVAAVGKIIPDSVIYF